MDKEKKFTPFRVISSKGVLTRRHTDHLSLMVEIKMKNKRTIRKPEDRWNTTIGVGGLRMDLKPAC